MSRLEGAPEADAAEDCPHPRENFALFGHAAAEAELAAAYRAGTLPHAILIGGAEGIGKATLAWRLTRFVLANPDPARVGEARDLAVREDHPVARRIIAKAHGDVIGLKREWNEKTKKHFSEIRIDDVRKAIALFQKAAGEGGWRVCIVDSAEDLNRAGANALLKIIEEPPPRALFLIVAHRPGQVLATIRSRCRKLILPALQTADVARAARHVSPGANEAAAGQAAARAEGSVREALRLLHGGSPTLDAAIERQLAGLPQIHWREAHALADSVSGREGDLGFDILVRSMTSWLTRQVREGAARGAGAAQLAPYAEAYEMVQERTREADALNLDRRALILALLGDLAQAAAAARAGAG